MLCLFCGKLPAALETRAAAFDFLRHQQPRPEGLNLTHNFGLTILPWILGHFLAEIEKLSQK